MQIESKLMSLNILSWNRAIRGSISCVSAPFGERVGVGEINMGLQQLAMGAPGYKLE